VIGKLPFAPRIMNGRIGSILVVQVGLQAPHWMTASGYKATKSGVGQRVRLSPETRHRKWRVSGIDLEWL